MQIKEIFTIDSLDNHSILFHNRKHLSQKSGIYCFVNKITNKRYIGKAKNLYIRLNEHIKAKKSNRALQAAFAKYGLENFSFIIYKYFTYNGKEASHKLLTDLETRYIKAFPFNELYNYM